MSGRIKYNENNSRARARAEIRGDNTLTIPTCDNTTKNFLFCLNIVPSPLKLEDLKKIKMRVDAIIIGEEANGGGGRSRRRKKRKTRKTRSKRRKKKQTRKSRR
jgi:hypothetical protein